MYQKAYTGVNMISEAWTRVLHHAQEHISIKIHQISFLQFFTQEHARWCS